MTAAPPPTGALAYYPQYCFHLSPTLNKWCPLRAADLAALTRFADFEAQHVFFHRNHPIKWVRIAGVVVASAEYFGRRVYTVDDGSGATVECLFPRPSLVAIAGTTTATATATATTSTSTSTFPDFHPGQVVDVKGDLRPFRDTLQVHVRTVTVLRATEQEVQFWAKRQAFAADVLDRPWVLDKQTVRACRRAARGKREEEAAKAAETETASHGANASGKRLAAEEPPPPPKLRKWTLGPAPAAAAADDDTTRDTGNGQGREDSREGSHGRGRSRSPVRPAMDERPPKMRKWILGPAPGNTEHDVTTRHTEEDDRTTTKENGRSQGKGKSWIIQSPSGSQPTREEPPPKRKKWLFGQEE